MRSQRILTALKACALVGLVVAVVGGSGPARAAPAATGSPDVCADLNGDGLVTLADLLIQISYFAQFVPPAPPQADLDENTAIGIADILLLVKLYNTTTDCQDSPIGPKGTPKATPTPAPTPPPEPEMSLTVKGAGAHCDDPAKPSKCNVPPDSQFTLAVEVNNPPVKGYVGFQTQIVYGSLKYKPTAWGGDEVVWPGGSPPYGLAEVRIGNPTGQEGVVAHLAVTTPALPPYPVSAYVGNIVEIALNCPSSGSYEIALPVLSVANPAGSHFVKDGIINALPTITGQRSVDADGDTTPELVDVADTLLINCAESPVGGLAELPDVAGTPLETPEPSGASAGVVGGVMAAVATGAITLGGAAWYVRSRRVRR